jgi:hypothetical protein
MIRREWRHPMLASLVVVLSLPAAGLAAQETPWGLTAGASQTWFSGGLRDTSPGAADYTLSPTVAWGVAADHALGAVRLGLGVSYLSTGLQVSGTGVTISDESLGATEWGVAALVTVPVLRVGDRGAGLTLSAGPAVGFWSLTDADSRSVIEGTALLRFAAAVTPAWRLLVSVGGRVSASPFLTSEVPAEFETSTLWATQVGIGVRYGP